MLPCCTDRLGTALIPLYGVRLGHADGLRASKLKHAVEGMNSDGDFCRTTPVSQRAQGVPDHSFKPADGALHQGSLIISRCLLPTHAAMLSDALKRPVALGRSGLHTFAQHCR